MRSVPSLQLCGQPQTELYTDYCSHGTSLCTDSKIRTLVRASQCSTAKPLVHSRESEKTSQWMPPRKISCRQHCPTVPECIGVYYTDACLNNTWYVCHSKRARTHLRPLVGQPAHLPNGDICINILPNSDSSDTYTLYIAKHIL